MLWRDYLLELPEPVPQGAPLLFLGRGREGCNRPCLCIAQLKPATAAVSPNRAAAGKVCACVKVASSSVPSAARSRLVSCSYVALPDDNTI